MVLKISGEKTVETSIQKGIILGVKSAMSWDICPSTPKYVHHIQVVDFPIQISVELAGFPSRAETEGYPKNEGPVRHPTRGRLPLPAFIPHALHGSYVPGLVPSAAEIQAAWEETPTSLWGRKALKDGDFCLDKLGYCLGGLINMLRCFNYQKYGDITWSKW